MPLYLRTANSYDGKGSHRIFIPYFQLLIQINNKKSMLRVKRSKKIEPNLLDKPILFEINRRICKFKFNDFGRNINIRINATIGKL